MSSNRRMLPPREAVSFHSAGLLTQFPPWQAGAVMRSVPQLEKAMKRISILYPDSADSWFDVEYYTSKHMPMAIERLSKHPGYIGVSVERGICGAVPGTRAAYTVMCHYLFASVDDFMAAYTPHAAVLKGDIPNYTDIEPTIQFGDVLI
jgi:uncharacterized protein (TIGR02118 family)